MTMKPTKATLSSRLQQESLYVHREGSQWMVQMLGRTKPGSVLPMTLFLEDVRSNHSCPVWIFEHQASIDDFLNDAIPGSEDLTKMINLSQRFDWKIVLTINELVTEALEKYGAFEPDETARKLNDRIFGGMIPDLQKLVDWKPTGGVLDPRGLALEAKCMQDVVSGGHWLYQLHRAQAVEKAIASAYAGLHQDVLEPTTVKLLLVGDCLRWEQLEVHGQEPRMSSTLASTELIVVPRDPDINTFTAYDLGHLLASNDHWKQHLGKYGAGVTADLYDMPYHERLSSCCLDYERATLKEGREPQVDILIAGGSA